jgi:centrosomal protein CEP41
MIIIYGFDERQSIGSAQLLAQKGYENVFMISGGIEAFMQEYPEFLEGKKVPVLPKK